MDSRPCLRVGVSAIMGRLLSHRGQGVSLRQIDIASAKLCILGQNFWHSYQLIISVISSDCIKQAWITSNYRGCCLARFSHFNRSGKNSDWQAIEHSNILLLLLLLEGRLVSTTAITVLFSSVQGNYIKLYSGSWPERSRLAASRSVLD